MNACGWVCLLLAAALSLPSLSSAGPPSRFRHRDPVIQPLDRESATERLLAVRSYDPGVDLVLMFELLERRRKEDVRAIGVLESTRISGAPMMRISVVEPEDETESETEGYRVLQQWRIRGGAIPKVEEGSPGDRGEMVFKEVERSRWLDPLVAGFSHTPFDLLMPYLFWKDSVYEGPERVNGRSSHLFRFAPPDEWIDVLRGSGIATVRVVLDRQFNAPLLIEYLAEDDTVVRSLRAVSFREVDDAWIVGTLESRDYDKDLRTRLVMLGGGVVPSALLRVGSEPQDRIRIPFTQLDLEWF